MGGIDAAARRGPDQYPGLWLRQPPAVRLLRVVVPSAEWAEVAFARPATLVARNGMVLVAAGRGATAAGEGTGRLPDRDQVPQDGRRPVAGRLPHMTAIARLQLSDRDTCQPVQNTGRQVQNTGTRGSAGRQPGGTRGEPGGCSFAGR